MRHTLIMLGMLLATGCTASAAPQPSSPPSGGGNFMPAYQTYLKTGQFPHDDSCEPTDLHTLLVPCDHAG